MSPVSPATRQPSEDEVQRFSDAAKTKSLAEEADDIGAELVRKHYAYNGRPDLMPIITRLTKLRDALRSVAAIPSAIESPTERQVQAGAVILATTPLIDAPKQLTHNEWMGLSRSILEAANAARDKSSAGQTAMESLPPVGVYLCEDTAKFASYWLNAAREARDAEKHGDALMFAEQAVNGWKNLAYSLARQAHYYLKTQTHFAESSVPSSTAFATEEFAEFIGRLSDLAHKDSFWEGREYGNRFYYGPNAGDYIARDVFQAFLHALKSTRSPLERRSEKP